MYYAFTAFLCNTLYGISILHSSQFVLRHSVFLDTVTSEQLKTARQQSPRVSSFSLATSATQSDTEFFLLEEKHTAHFCAHVSLEVFKKANH